jgi:two-component sensor histidine kinase
LATWRVAEDLAKLVDSVLCNYKQESLVFGRDNVEEHNNKMNTNIKQCLCNVVNETLHNGCEGVEVIWSSP